MQLHDCPSACTTSPFTVPTNASEPAPDRPHPPACTSTLPSNSIIVDNQPSKVNVVGCGAGNWSSQGTFSVAHGTRPDGAPLGVIDWHQLGVGLGGHVWFTKNRTSPADTFHINVGTWTPPTLDGFYNIKVHIPSAGASASAATYRIHRGDGHVVERIIDQHYHEDRWVSLGNYRLYPGAKVSLSNLSTGTLHAPTPTAGTANIAYDALAFTPVQGNVQRQVIDAASVFRRTQNLDTSLPFGSGFEPLRSRQEILDWVDEMTVGNAERTGALQYLPCGSVVPGQECVEPEALQVFEELRSLRLSSGTTRTADILAFPNKETPPTNLPVGWLEASAQRYKEWSRTEVEYLIRSDGSIDPSSVTVNYQHRTGDTELMPFFVDLVEAYEQAYAVAPPELGFYAEDLGEYNHQSRVVDPLAQGGIVPGRAYRNYGVASYMHQGCIGTKTIGGSVIAYRPMVASAAVRTEVEGWMNRVQSLGDRPDVPDAVVHAAEQMYYVFFRDSIFANQLFGTPFAQAAPIWLQQEMLICPNGTVRPTNAFDSVAGPEGRPQGSDQVLYASYMPSVYQWRNGTPMGLTGAAGTNPVLAGDFRSFTNLPGTGAGAYDACISEPSRPGFEHTRAGNPWSIRAVISDPNIVPDAVRTCDEPTGTPNN